MKYFVNFPYTAESLKNEFRALSLKLHPDTGGNAEEFKDMMQEYEQIARNLSGTKQHAQNEAERKAEEARRREEEEERREWEAYQERQRQEREAERKAEEERKAKARPIYEKRCKKWAHLMEDLTPFIEAENNAYKNERQAAEDFGYRSAEYKEAGKATKAARTATHAARRRNLLKMAQTAFKGVKFSLRYDNGWGGGFTIAWTDGPSLEEFKAATDYDLFVSGWDTFDGMTDCADYERADFTDFADKYSGHRGEVEFDRTISDENRQKMADVLKRLNPDFTDPEARKRYDCNSWEDIAVFIDEEKIREFFRIFGADFDSVTDEQKRAQRTSRHNFRDYMDSRKTLAGWINALADFITFKTDDEKMAEKPAEFAPRYGATLRALFKLVGGQSAAFWQRDPKTRKSSPLSLSELIEALERGEAVAYGKKHEYTDAEGNIESVSYWGVNNGGYKVQKARAEKFAAAGYTLSSSGHSSTYADVEITGITPKTAAALRAELADIERQRQQWEAKQTAQKPQDSAETKQPTNTQPSDSEAVSAPQTVVADAPAEGLQLIDTAEGVAVVSEDWKTTYFNKKHIKAHGCHWNKEAKRWEATDPNDVAKVRAWFALRSEEQTTPEADTLEDAQDITENAQDSAETAEQTNTQHTDSETVSDDAQQPASVSPLLDAVADLFRTFADIIKQAKRWEGVTIPAATLERWKQQATEGTQNTAARLSEVCACLGSLTPDSREQFDALGVIFWTLADKIKTGTDSDSLQCATDYAAAQLFDLIERTQTENQARAVREAVSPDDPDPFRKAA